MMSIMMKMVMIPVQCLWCCCHNKVMARLNRIYFKNAKRPPTLTPSQPTNLGCESACHLLESTPTITIYFFLFHLKPDLFQECQTAPNGCRLSHQSNQPTWAVSTPVSARVYTHHHHLFFFLFHLKRWHSFHCPTEVAGWDDLDGWYQDVEKPTDSYGHPS